MFQLVAIAASAGGLSALTTVLAEMPAEFPLPIAVVQHVDPTHRSLIADILARRTPLKVKQAEAGERLLAGVVYIAPPGSHMLVRADRSVQLTQTEPVHFVRPSADQLFESAAQALGTVIGVILSGSGSDGAGGAVAIKGAGGAVIAQDEASAAFFGMPQAAIAMGVVDFVLPLGQIAQRLIDLARTT